MARANLLIMLPAEIICLILAEIVSVGDFRFFAESCSYVHSIFIQQKELFLSNLLQRAIPPEILDSDAQVAIRSLSYPFPKSDSDNESDEVQFISYLRKETSSKFSNTRIPLHVSSQLFKLQLANEDCLKDICRRARLLFHDDAYIPPKQPPSESDFENSITSIERFRILRALYRYNTCQSLQRAYCARRRDVEQRVAALAELLAPFKPWEAEEIACVHDYVLQRLGEALEKLEDEFVQMVKDADSKIRNDAVLNKKAGDDHEFYLMTLLRLLRPEDPEERQCLGYDQSIFDEGGPHYFFSVDTKSDHGSMIRKLASKGTPFLYKFLLADHNTRLHLFDSHGTQGSLHHGLEQSSNMRGLSHGFVRFKEDSPLLPNSAWAWSKRYRCSDGYGQMSERSLRSWGYVFWDHCRLNQTSLLKKPRSDRRLKEESPDINSRFLPCERMPSAEERLEDLGFELVLETNWRAQLRARD